jgi:HD-like signal output (HDOD) protein
LVEADAPVVTEILRVANYAALKPRQKINSLREAIAWLGVVEVRNIALAATLRSELFCAPGHGPESEQLWREAWLASWWAKEIASLRRRPLDSAFLAGLMHRSGAALALKTLARFELDRRTAMDARTFGNLLAEFETACGRVLMTHWHVSSEVQAAASDWQSYRTSQETELAGTVNAAHLLAEHTLYPLLLAEQAVLDSDVFGELGVFVEDRVAMLAQRDQVRELAGLA